MYCYAEKLSKIRNKLVGMKLKEIYPDWSHGIIYLMFSDSLNTVIVTVKNNYYAGIDILESAEIKRKEE